MTSTANPDFNAALGGNPAPTAGATDNAPTVTTTTPKGNPDPLMDNLAFEAGAGYNPIITEENLPYLARHVGDDSGPYFDTRDQFASYAAMASRRNREQEDSMTIVAGCWIQIPIRGEPAARSEDDDAEDDGAEDDSAEEETDSEEDSSGEDLFDEEGMSEREEILAALRSASDEELMTELRRRMPWL